MTIKDRIEAIKLNFKKILDKLKLAQEYKLPDGQVLTLDPGPEQGAMATINGAPAPDAEYVLPDGQVCKVAAGVITEVVAKQPDAQPAAPAANMADDVKEAISQIIVKFQEEFETKLKAQAEAHQLELTALKTQLEKYNEPINEVLKLVAEIADSGSAEPAEPKPNNFNKNTEKVPERIQKIRSYFEN